MRFVDQWLAALSRHAERLCLTDLNMALRGCDLLEASQTYAAALVAHNVQPGDVIAFHGKVDAQWILAFLGVLRSAATAAILPETDDEPTLARLIYQTQAKFVVCSSEHDAEHVLRCMRANPQLVQIILRHGLIRNPAVVRLDLLLEGGRLFLRDRGEELAHRGRLVVGDDIALIAFSAGTMALPRPVRMSHHRLEQAVCAVAEKLGDGPALYFDGRVDLIDHNILLWAALRQGREVAFTQPTRPWEWLATAPRIADAFFAEAWPVVGPQALPHGVQGWMLKRRLVRHLYEAFPNLRGIHSGFSVPTPSIVQQAQRAGLRVTWGYGLVEAHGYCTWEETGRGFGTVLPHIRLGQHQGGLAFAWADLASGWWQATGDWARTVGPWIEELEPHGMERGEPMLLATARKVERALMDHPWISAVFVAGPEPLAGLTLISLRKDVVLTWARHHGLEQTDWNALLADPKLVEPLLARVRAIGHRFGLRLRPIILPHTLTEKTGELTARGELRRALVLRRAAAYGQAPRPEDKTDFPT